MLAGDFTAFASPACNGGRQITLRAPFVNNRIDPALFSKPAVNFAKQAADIDDPCGRIIYSNPSYDNDHMAVGRIDYQRSAKHSIFGRYLVESEFNPPAYDLNHNLLSAGNGDDGWLRRSRSGTPICSAPNIVNSFRLTANRFAGGKDRSRFTDCHCGPARYRQSRCSTTRRTIRDVNVTGGFTVSAQGRSDKSRDLCGSAMILSSFTGTTRWLLARDALCGG